MASIGEMSMFPDTVLSVWKGKGRTLVGECHGGADDGKEMVVVEVDTDEGPVRLAMNPYQAAMLFESLGGALAATAARRKPGQSGAPGR